MSFQRGDQSRILQVKHTFNWFKKIISWKILTWRSFISIILFSAFEVDIFVKLVQFGAIHVTLFPVLSACGGGCCRSCGRKWSSGKGGPFCNITHVSITNTFDSNVFITYKYVFECSTNLSMWLLRPCLLLDSLLYKHKSQNDAQGLEEYTISL